MRAEKIRIAKKAAQFVEPDMALSLDSGSTNRFLAEELLCDERFRYEELNIVTYSLRTALTTSQKFNVSIPGGAVFTAQDTNIEVDVSIRDVGVPLLDNLQDDIEDRKSVV